MLNTNAHDLGDAAVLVAAAVETGLSEREAVRIVQSAQRTTGVCS